MAEELVHLGLAGADKEACDMHSRVVDRVEREVIAQVLAECEGVQIKAAGRLGINRNTLHKKLKQYGLDDEESAELIAPIAGRSVCRCTRALDLWPGRSAAALGQIVVVPAPIPSPHGEAGAGQPTRCTFWRRTASPPEIMLSGVWIIIVFASYAAALGLELRISSGVLPAAVPRSSPRPWSDWLRRRSIWHVTPRSSMPPPLSSPAEWLYMAAAVLAIVYLAAIFYLPGTPIGILMLPLVLGALWPRRDGLATNRSLRPEPRFSGARCMAWRSSWAPWPSASAFGPA